MAGPVCACHSQSIDWQNGAKRGWIVEIYQSDSQSEKLPECLQAIPESERMNRHFVKVQYRHVRLMRVAIAELPKELQAKIDDQVELWPEDCSRGKLSRISKLLSSNNQ